MISSVATKTWLRVDACGCSSQHLKDVAVYLLKYISDFFGSQHLRVRTPAIFGSSSHVELAWWPSTTILIYDSEVKCFDGINPQPRIITHYLIKTNDIYEWLQSQLRDQLVPFDEETDTED